MKQGCVRYKVIVLFLSVGRFQDSVLDLGATDDMAVKSLHIFQTCINNGETNVEVIAFIVNTKRDPFNHVML